MIDLKGGTHLVITDPQVAELPTECARTCPGLESYMADLTTLLGETNYVARQTGQLDLWCQHRGAVTCGFQSTECLLAAFGVCGFTRTKNYDQIHFLVIIKT